MPPTLILASTSPYRRQLLARLGLPFQQESPACDEEALKDDRLPPGDLARLLAVAKADSIARRRPDAVVIGSDQLVASDDGILGKPGSGPAAVDQLVHLAGTSHRLLTAVCVRHGERVQEHLDETVLEMRPLDRAALERYVARDLPVDCAGAYKLEAGGITLFSAIRSADHSAITGLPLIWLCGCLRGFGYAIP